MRLQLGFYNKCNLEMEYRHYRSSGGFGRPVSPDVIKKSTRIIDMLPPNCQSLIRHYMCSNGRTWYVIIGPCKWDHVPSINQQIIKRYASIITNDALWKAYNAGKIE